MMNLIPLPRMSEYLLEDFMIPMGLTANEVSAGTGIPLHELHRILADDQELTPTQASRLSSFFGVSCDLFYDLQEELKERAGVRALAYA